MSRTSSSRVEDSKESRTQELKAHDLLRSEARGRAIVGAGTGDDERDELDLVVVEAEVRSVAEDITAGIGELVSGAVDVQLLVAGDAFGVDQNDRPDSNARKPELVVGEEPAGSADGTSTMVLSELDRDDQNVALLLFGDSVHRF